jgi:hypothetical protein
MVDVKSDDLARRVEIDVQAVRDLPDFNPGIGF